MADRDMVAAGVLPCVRVCVCVNVCASRDRMGT